MAMTYEHVYVAQIAYGAKDVHTLRVLREAESYPGPSLVIAYSPCIAHGVDLAGNTREQDLAVMTGHWPLFRRDPRVEGNPFRLDSAEPSLPIKELMERETRFAMLARGHPEAAVRFLAEAQREADRRYVYYRDLAQIKPPATDR
jgi:pyruvate-ferredoxin/flavodoxin oxidoreductase